MSDSRLGVESLPRVAAISTYSTSKVIAAASVGTVFEWYDFTLYGALATVIADRFFAGVDPVTGFIFALLTFAVGFIMRPVGAIIFGRIGDKIGRKKTFLVTISIMGFSTVGVGCLPTYHDIGTAAPILLICLRMLQGTALGGEFGGAATYVAEHSGKSRRGLNTSLISATGTVGLLLSFFGILCFRLLTGSQFDIWGWRLPFLFSIVLLGISLRIRMRMNESPAFEKLITEDRIARAPLGETFLQWRNLKRVLLALFAICGGMTCVYYTAVIYPTFFLIQTLKVPAQQVTNIVTIATLFCIPLFLISGWLCDRLGRKPVLVTGFLLTATTIFPIFHAITHYANPALAKAQAATPIFVDASPAECSFMFNPIGARHFTSSCDIAKQALAAAGVSYHIQPVPTGTATSIHIGNSIVQSYNANGLDKLTAAVNAKAFRSSLATALAKAGYPSKASVDQFNAPMIFILLLVLLTYMTLTLTPTAPMLVELFPTRIRYTAMSFPYHFASGWIGGLLPTFTFAFSAQKGDIYFGLWYPVTWIVIGIVMAVVFLPETKDADLDTMT